MILDNKISPPQSTTEFTYNYYLTDMAKKDIVKIWIKQVGDELLYNGFEEDFAINMLNGIKKITDAWGELRSE